MHPIQELCAQKLSQGVMWPRIDTDTEDTVHLCVTCQNSCRSLSLQHQCFLGRSQKKPWSRLHIDFVAPFQDIYSGRLFFKMVRACLQFEV
ncbi:hypothetical protein XENTR_v10018453 [Xenopus tropicalis]|nr:hypothetical protein XENTR_v10018453 [Xenopus tropicalis]